MGCDIVFKLNPNKFGDLDRSPNEYIIRDTSIQKEDISITEKLAKEISKGENSDCLNILYDWAKRCRGLILSRTNESLSQEGVVGNISFSDLQKIRGTQLTFNPDFTFNPEILFVRKLKINGKDFSGRIRVGDRVVFVIRDTISDLARFNNYLKQLSGILNGDFSDDEKLDELFEKVKELDGTSDIKSTKDLLLEFINNNGRISDLSVKVPGLYTHLEVICNLFLESKSTHISNDDFTNELFSSNNIKYESNFTYRIPVKTFLELIKKYNRVTITGKNWAKTVLEGSNDEVTARLKDMFNNAVKIDPESDELYQFSSFDGTNIILKTLFNTVERVYRDQYTYNELSLSPEVKTYRGFGIYKITKNGIDQFFVSQDSLTTYSMNTKRFASLEDAKKHIDSLYQMGNVSIAKTLNVGFKTLDPRSSTKITDTSAFHPTNSVVKSLYIENFPKINIENFDEEDRHYLEGTKITFKEALDYYLNQINPIHTTDFRRVIDSTEKLGMFIYLLQANVGDTNARLEHNYKESVITEILKKIEGATVKRYLIESAEKKEYKEKGIGKSYYEYKVLELSDDTLVTIDTKYNRPAPIIGELQSILDLFRNKYGIQSEILTRDEMREKFKGIRAGAKAFIKDGVIYINGSDASSRDLFHEYSHLLLGVIKSTNYDMYLKLMNLISTSNEKRVINLKRNFRTKYQGMSETDLNEEVFSELFGDYLSGKITLSKVEQMAMAKAKEYTTELLGLILTRLDLEKKESSLYEGKMVLTFKNLSSEMSKLTYGIKNGRGGEYRHASNYITHLLKNNKLTEVCDL